MLHRLIHLLFPEQCQKCGKPGTALCGECVSRLPLATTLPKGIFAVFDYGNSIVRSAIRNLKYHRHGELGRALINGGTSHILAYLSDVLHSEQDERILLVPIPEHPKKQT